MTDDKRSDREGEEPSQIKVTDRRHFTREGERRAPDAEPTTIGGDVGLGIGSAPGETQGKAAGKGQAFAQPGAQTQTSAQAQDRGRAGRPEAAGEPPSIDFVAFVHSLYMSALIHLGEVENPYSHQFEVNLDVARENIDILLMLQDKTAGNLTPEEQGYLSQALPQLQMLYVHKSR